MHFSTYEKDMLNDETIELLAPYLDLEEFNPLVARHASRAAEGLCVWVRAMSMYHKASKVVKPKLDALQVASHRLHVAEQELRLQSEKLGACKVVLERLQHDFEKQMGEKASIEANAKATRDRMLQVCRLCRVVLFFFGCFAATCGL